MKAFDAQRRVTFNILPKHLASRSHEYSNGAVVDCGVRAYDDDDDDHNNNTNNKKNNNNQRSVNEVHENAEAEEGEKNLKEEEEDDGGTVAQAHEIPVYVPVVPVGG